MKPNRHLLILAREVRGLTQDELAELSGIDQGLISRHETGWRPISPDELAKYVEALGFPAAWFYQEYEPVPAFHIQCKHGWVKTGGKDE
jgi:transcriptional regulator with XRE-family HTH domain